MLFLRTTNAWFMPEAEAPRRSHASCRPPVQARATTAVERILPPCVAFVNHWVNKWFTRVHAKCESFWNAPQRIFMSKRNTINIFLTYIQNRVKKKHYATTHTHYGYYQYTHLLLPSNAEPVYQHNNVVDDFRICYYLIMTIFKTIWDNPYVWSIQYAFNRPHYPLCVKRLRKTHSDIRWLLNTD